MIRKIMCACPRKITFERRYRNVGIYIYRGVNRNIYDASCIIT